MALRIAATPAPEMLAAPALTAGAIDLSDVSSPLVETCSALALSLRDGDLDAATRLFSFVVDQLADRRSAITDVLAPMMLSEDAREALHPASGPLLATCTAFLSGLRRPVASAGQPTVLLYSSCGGASALTLHMAAVLLDDAHVPTQLQLGLDAESFGRAANNPTIGPVALAVCDAPELESAESVIRRVRRAGVPVVVVADPTVVASTVPRSVGATGTAWQPGEITEMLLRLRGPLSHAETEVLRLAADGYTNVRIAHELGISVSAVKARLEASYAKVGAADRTHAVAIALRRRWIQ